MTSSPALPPPPWRGLVFAGSALALAATAHTLGHGTPPGAGHLAMLLPPVALLSAMLVRCRRCPVAIGLGLAAIQGLLHFSFIVFSAGGCSARVESVGHGRHLALAPNSGCATHLAVLSQSMIFWHFLATLGTALLLAYGERLLQRLLSATRSHIPTPAVMQPRPSCDTHYRPPTLPGPQLNHGGPGRRGPPLWLLAAEPRHSV